MHFSEYLVLRSINFIRIFLIIFFLFFLCLIPVRAESQNFFDKARELCVAREYDKSLEYYDMAIESNPFDYCSLVYKGFALLMLEKTKEADDCFNKAFSINPLDAYLLYRRLGDTYKKGKELSGFGNNDEAWKYFDSIFLMGPFEAYSNYKKITDLYDRAINLFYSGNYKESLNCLNKAIEIEPHNNLLQELKKKCLEMIDD